jgi:hypothetical protein
MTEPTAMETHGMANHLMLAQLRPKVRKSTMQELSIEVSPAKVATSCIVVAVLFVIIDLVTQYGRYYPFDFPGRFRLDRLFHMGREANVPAWFSTVLFIFVALLLGIIAYAKTVARAAFRYQWLILTVGFVYLSADEAAMLHEEFGGGVAVLFPNTVFSHGWFVAGAIGVVLLGVVYLSFLFSLPRKTRRLFFAAGAIFVSGAIGVEALASPYELGRAGDFTFAMLVALEEFLELTGVSIFSYALMDYIYTMMDGLTFVIRSPGRKSLTLDSRHSL